MRLEERHTDETILHELGQRLRRSRLERNLTQVELADAAGVERKAVQRIEAGESVRIGSFVRVLRALGLLEGLDRLVPEPSPSPIELLKLQGKARQRASGERVAKQHEPAGDRAWRWGDESPDGER